MGATSPSPNSTLLKFKESGRAAYRIETGSGTALQNVAPSDWLKAVPEAGGSPVALGSRITLQVRPGTDLSRILDGRPLRLSRRISENLCILQAAHSLSASLQAAQLAELPEVTVAIPVMRRSRQLFEAYARRPNDPYFKYQWYLENRSANGTRAGADINARAAWPWTRGEGVTIAFVDEGVELSHPELALRSEGAPHFNFETGTTNGSPSAPDQIHGTAVAGIAVAEQNNRRGMTGVAPLAKLASWIVFATNEIYWANGYLLNDEQLMDMFQYKSNIVAVQNHSWGSADLELMAPSALEQAAISNAVAFGRNGLGVVMVRSGGNYREEDQNVNDDGYANDPRVIAVGAALETGRVTSYSNPGACLLVAAPGGDMNAATIFTTDRQGGLGYNTYVSPSNDLADYTHEIVPPFVGTSASAPQVAGLAALILSVNGNLTYRDVQQIILHSARHLDLSDPDLSTNAAGFTVSHNVGFGIPDAGWAVRLAKIWPTRPALSEITVAASNPLAIPDDGLRVVVSGDAVPENLKSIRCLPSYGPHPDAPTAALTVSELGKVSAPITADLQGRAALIERGISFFWEKILWAADAGARFAVIYNDAGDNLIRMGQTDFSPIPAVFVAESDGAAIRAYLQQQPNAIVQLKLQSADYRLRVTNTLSCEYVGVRIKSNHTRRGDLRITLLSPAGTRSILQQLNNDPFAGPADWTFWSTHHFYESSAGIWTVSISDEMSGETGSISSVDLVVRGVAISDTDADGLHDPWEVQFFQSLAQGPRDDFDEDGYSNVREFITGMNPTSAPPLVLDIAAVKPDQIRLSWNSSPALNYTVWAHPTLDSSASLRTNIVGKFPVTEWIVPTNSNSVELFHLRYSTK